ncbi:hypothetical protein GLOTRDRAFT_134249 [Gloeophyllum trabeum ATCC 11539]|uniref:Uncharacterized protein n=1 Tax=Gloeophyllum trabeum (strain ATCC 11539 / FP-39264 / Madison 617) TaxID=670483 RepID=S7PRV2_GLOTA|nr:uncharacterized protein GLOTRDRAFT_134249 [Gloeophyllum trabeum ATCC 11539]EPQ50108.1 hypothetical protein GLOTRDRAFT_134249 [Gloeophyllum trabeum ATCC 11539]
MQKAALTNVAGVRLWTRSQRITAWSRQVTLSARKQLLEFSITIEGFPEDDGERNDQLEELLQVVSRSMTPGDLQELQVETAMAAGEWRARFGHLASVTRLYVAGADDGLLDAISTKQSAEFSSGHESTGNVNAGVLFPALRALTIEEHSDALYTSDFVGRLASVLHERRAHGHGLERLTLRGVEEHAGVHQTLLMEAAPCLTIRPPAPVHIRTEGGPSDETDDEELTLGERRVVRDATSAGPPDGDSDSVLGSDVLTSCLEITGPRANSYVVTTSVIAVFNRRLN